MGILDIFEHEEWNDILKLTSPGAPLRKGLDNVLMAGTGGLIVIGDNEEILSLVDGGFELNAEYTPSSLYELSKMDGAIVLDENIEKIRFANTQLMPKKDVSTTETGTRHRTAERVAKQTGATVIAISQRRSIITVYKGSKKYVVEDTTTLFSKANQAFQTLEKAKLSQEQAVLNLNALEFADMVTIYDVVFAMSKVEMVLRVTNTMEMYLLALGEEGFLIRNQYEQLIGRTKDEQDFIINDYVLDDLSKETFKKKLSSLSNEELVDLTKIAKIMGFSGYNENLDKPTSPRGYRLLSKIHKLPQGIIYNLIEYFGSFQAILSASIEELDEVEGIGEIRATYIRNGLIKMKKLAVLDRLI
ncbi:DNA integrity scanning protein DisA [Peptostreptococcus russellii]|uniref:DNA integrity scanning protein DisA n=1 Tax=Peptostreptococcus russellii TaxID=215200 RepID=A0A1H8K778_9FIRM|nr:DNA integrity scanning diadenylate cyclase DisA [Peptostreptococcus russellii]MBC2578469.1 DNA integrity scanning protein DisA [Peptostreptococcus russellii]SEN88268.1 diadenylate cyclase [Peptostreptococcus russellii]